MMNTAVVAIGVFDGVHLGHQRLFDEAKKQAQKLHLPLHVYTFQPHPRQVLQPQTALTLIEPLLVRLWRLRQLGVAHTTVQTFDLEFAATSANTFIEKILVHSLHARMVVVGQGFCFGHRQQGTVALIRELGVNWQLEIIEVAKCCHQNQRVSSSRIRTLLAQQQPENANVLLGRPLALFGQVIHGKQRGRTLGFPTANLDCLIPPPLPSGVYAGFASCYGKQRLPCVVNIGTAPTWNEQRPLTVEAHCLDLRSEQLDLYGQAIVLEICCYLRNEQRFANTAALIAQINHDITTSREKLAACLLPIVNYQDWLTIAPKT